MKDSIYFSHDYNAHLDPKIVKLRMKLGWEWYGLFWATLEVMREDADVVLRISELDANAYRLHYDSSAYREFLDYLVELWLLHFDNKDWVYFSQRLQKDVEHMRAKSKKAQAAANARRRARDANALHPHSESNAIEDSIVEDKDEKEEKGGDDPLSLSPLYYWMSDELITKLEDFRESNRQQWNEFNEIQFKTIIDSLKSFGYNNDWMIYCVKKAIEWWWKKFYEIDEKDYKKAFWIKPIDAYRKFVREREDLNVEDMDWIEELFDKHKEMYWESFRNVAKRDFSRRNKQFLSSL